MDKSYLFDRNLLALSARNPDLCSRLSGAETNRNRYKFLESRQGEVIPARVDPSGTAHPLHSIMDPAREARRLIDLVGSDSFLILLGLGGGYYPKAALERDDIGMVAVIEYDLDGLAELLCHCNYAALFGDPRFHLFLDISGEELEREILNMYQPVLYGAIRVIPLRARTGIDPGVFAAAGNAIEAAIDKVSADYSVQAHFGTRWLSNIIRNLKPAGEYQEALPPVSRVAITAAGPSLSTQTEQLRQKRNEFFLIAADTSLPCLLNEGITPDAVISIDCQHISYYHFMDGLPEGILLFLDLASPPLLASRFKNYRFFTGGHPLTRYISRVWKALPELDTSGGNVTYAALSLAEELGAREIELYGADFSYPSGISYARGTYIYSFFGKSQNRFAPLEAQSSGFLFRGPLEKITRDNDSWYYETKALKFYRERLEEKISHMAAVLIPVGGMGAPINIRHSGNRQRSLRIFSSGKAAMSAGDFLREYGKEIAGLPEPGKNIAEYLSLLKDREHDVFTTILPAAAAIKRRHPLGRRGIPPGDFRELLEETKTYCLKEIEKLTGGADYGT